MKYLKLVLLFFCLSLYNCKTETKPKLTVNVVLSDSLSAKQLDGRLLLILSDNNESEPRFQVGEGLNAQPIFGMNVENWSGEKVFSFDDSVFGFPYDQLSKIKPGDYYIQAVLHVYETFKLSTGQEVKLPMDNGEGQHWNTSRWKFSIQYCMFESL